MLTLTLFPTLGTHMKSQGEILFKGGRAVTPSVLRPKQITKSCHEHHVYVIMYVMDCVDNIFVLKMINKNVKYKLFHNSYVSSRV